MPVTPRQEFEDTLAAYAMLRAETKFYRDVFQELQGLPKEKILPLDVEISEKIEAKDRNISRVMDAVGSHESIDNEELRNEVNDLAKELADRRNKLRNVVHTSTLPRQNSFSSQENLDILKHRINIIKQTIDQLSAAKAARERRTQALEEKALETQCVIGYLT